MNEPKKVVQKARRAEDIRMCNLVPGRTPGIAKPFMMPAKLKNQVRTGQTATPLFYKPMGKNLVGGTQWAIGMKKPGIAKPLIVAKQEKEALKEAIKANKEAAKLAPLKQAPVKLVPKAAPSAPPGPPAPPSPDAGVSGYYYGYGGFEDEFNGWR